MEFGNINFVIGGVPFVKIFRFTFVNFKYAKTFRILYELKSNTYKTLFKWRYQKMWKYKVDRSGWRPNPAIALRIKKLDKVNIGSHEGRVKFGYNYLQFVKERSV